MTLQHTVLIADDHPVVLNGLATSLKEWFTIVDTVASLDAVDERIATHRPDAVLLDLSFGDRSSLRLLPSYVVSHPDTRFIVLTAHVEPVLVEAALQSGAVGYVAKESPISEIRAAIEAALAGRTYVTPLVHGRRGDERSAEELLDRPGRIGPTERQLEILMMLRDGATHREIADTLEISTKTVEYHLNFLRRRVGILSTGLLIRWAEEFEDRPPPKGGRPRRGPRR